MSIIEEAKKAVRSGQVSQRATVLINGLIAENEQLRKLIPPSVEFDIDKEFNDFTEKQNYGMADK